MLCPLKKGSETYKDVEVNPDLQTDCKTQIETLLNTFQDVLTDLPGDTHLIQHDIKLRNLSLRLITSLSLILTRQN
jgi:hypothetical protein